MKKITSCSLCGSTTFDKVYSGLSDKMHHVKGQKFSVIKCQKCSLCLTDPAISSDAEFNKYYPEEYYSYNPPAKGKLSAADRITLCLYNLFYNPNQRINPLRYLLYPLSYFVRGTKIVPGGKILDIGCGAGFFLDRMRNLGMKPYGIELGVRGFKECKRKNIQAWNVPVEKAKIPANFFDIITINAVLEHVIDVKATLHACNRILKKNGVIILMVPNMDGYTARHYKENWADMDVPRHITHFNKKTVSKFLEDAGFIVQKIKGTGSAFQFTQSIAYKHPNTLCAKLAAKPGIALLFNLPVMITNIFKKSGRIEVYATKR